MPTTTNNGWTIPADTDLVKDGAAAIRTLGNAIDTTLGVYTPSTPGLTKINTTTFSGVASQSINDVFSTTYDTYRIIFYRDSVVTSTSGTYLRLRVSGSDLASGYNYAKVGIKSNNTTQTFYITGATEMGLVDGADSVGKAVIIDIANPFRTTSGTDKTFQFMGFGVSSALNAWFNTYGWVDSATSYTGFSLINDSGNMTGSVSVYGFNK